MRTQIFYYKGYVGVQSSLDAEGLFNNPAEPGQLGFIVDAEYVDIQPEALDEILKLEKSYDDIGDFDVKKVDEKTYIMWLGGPLRVFDFNDKSISGSRYLNTSTLKSNPEIKPSDEFINYIDSSIWLILKNTLTDE